MSGVGFIGGGNMATSLIGGLVESGFPTSEIWAADPVAGQRERLADTFSINVCPDNETPVRRCNTVVLAVKPQVMKEVVLALAHAARETRPLFVSIAAGVPTSALLEWLGFDAALVRCMPNTPALLRCGATGMYATPHVSEPERARAESILAAAGVAIWVGGESDLDVVTAVSGSGPAYFFMLMEQIIRSGTRLGLSEEIATRLTLQTALGAARMAVEGQDSPATLREKVTSPGGTTERALSIFSRHHIEEIVEEALRGACERSRELAGTD